MKKRLTILGFSLPLELAVLSHPEFYESKAFNLFQQYEKTFGSNSKNAFFNKNKNPLNNKTNKTSWNDSREGDFDDLDFSDFDIEATQNKKMKSHAKLCVDNALAEIYGQLRVKIRSSKSAGKDSSCCVVM